MNGFRQVVICAEKYEDLAWIFQYLKGTNNYAFCTEDNTVYNAISQLSELIDRFENGEINRRGKSGEWYKEILQILFEFVKKGFWAEEKLISLLNLVDELNEQLTKRKHGYVEKEQYKIQIEINKIIKDAQQSIFQNILCTPKTQIPYLPKEKLSEADCVVVVNGRNWNFREDVTILDINKFMCYYWQHSPEMYYILSRYDRIKDKQEIEGMIIGMSYLQRGINPDRLKKRFICLAIPSQDMFYNFEMCKYGLRNSRNIKYCILEITPYALYYDMSLSQETGNRTLQYLPVTGTYHHLQNGEEYLRYFYYLKEIYNNVFAEEMIFDLFEKFWKQNHCYEDPDLSVWKEEDNNTCVEEVKKVFNKPYPETCKENKEIFRAMYQFLQSQGIKTIMVTPPYSKVFRENMDWNMYEEIQKFIREELKSDDIWLDLVDDARFTEYYFSDWSHLNYWGSNLLADILNIELEKL